MFDKLGFTFRSATLALFLANAGLSILHIMATAWCSASGKYYGYFVDDENTLHSCAWELPARPYLHYVYIILVALSVSGLISDYVRTRDEWQTYKEVNLSRITFVISFMLMNELLQAVANVEDIKYAFGFENFFFVNLWYLFPVAAILLIISSWSIVKKVELIFTLNKRKR